MGLEKNGLKALRKIKEKQISFNNVLTLGRQGLHIKQKKVPKYLNLNLEQKESFNKLEVLGYADLVFKIYGATNVDSIDFSDYEGASIIHDMNTSVPELYKGKYDLIFDGGTLEHIFNFPVAIKNVMEMVKVGGYFLSVTCCNNFPGHGFYQFSPELFFRIFSKENGFFIENLYIVENDGVWYEVKDPEEAKSRVTFKNSKETYMVTIAKKIENELIFKTFPYQSDYVLEWTKENKKDVISFWGKVLRKLKSIYKNNFTKYDKKNFKKVKI